MGDHQFSVLPLDLFLLISKIKKVFGLELKFTFHFASRIAFAGLFFIEVVFFSTKNMEDSVDEYLNLCYQLFICYSFPCLGPETNIFMILFQSGICVFIIFNVIWPRSEACFQVGMVADLVRLPWGGRALYYWATGVSKFSI